MERATGPADAVVEIYRCQDKLREVWHYVAVLSKVDDEREDDGCQ